jgi:hypothetical protein
LEVIGGERAFLAVVRLAKCLSVLDPGPAASRVRVDVVGFRILCRPASADEAVVFGVSEKMLSQTLQTLERDGMVSREVHSAIPPRVEYSLTPLGTDVAERLRGLADLLEGSVDALNAARQDYDTRDA